MKYRIIKDGNGLYFAQMKDWFTRWQQIGCSVTTEQDAIDKINSHRRYKALSKQIEVVKEFK